MSEGETELPASNAPSLTDGMDTHSVAAAATLPATAPESVSQEVSETPGSQSHSVTQSTESDSVPPGECHSVNRVRLHTPR